ncbi:hypothetical protein [Candidatus Mycoplasma haematominutum]|uniref:Uncharacterized protein n=1 Tax=Candidatus Mycoplasma haematominutum 'Birmingham 1' TaxID=1116213 RepID=G8C2R7_9MOLU|nr:hypothetical protein [Candidatus Mycoplasma haematominutum]CCE66615.1 hypothetical protein MHM_00970 [Candidatus Mycoplasma haematominutum 'Birmingham 1']
MLLRGLIGATSIAGISATVAVPVTLSLSRSSEVLKSDKVGENSHTRGGANNHAARVSVTLCNEPSPGEGASISFGAPSQSEICWTSEISDSIRDKEVLINNLLSLSWSNVQSWASTNIVSQQSYCKDTSSEDPELWPNNTGDRKCDGVEYIGLEDTKEGIWVKKVRTEVSICASQCWELSDSKTSNSRYLPQWAKESEESWKQLQFHTKQNISPLN